MTKSEAIKAAIRDELPQIVLACSGRCTCGEKPARTTHTLYPAYTYIEGRVKADVRVNARCTVCSAVQSVS